MKNDEPATTAANLRALIAQERLRIYRIAPRVPAHPSTISLILNEHVPLQPAMAARILRAILEEAGRE